MDDQLAASSSSNNNANNAPARKYGLEDLLYLMQRLRDPETGCPWDLKQSYDTIVPHTLEEAYEVADAIERGDMADLKDELGDLLFQVVFYAQLGAEDKNFEFVDIADNVVRKLLRRHPHVFPDQNLHASFPAGTNFSDEEIKQQWERIKAEERALKKSSQVGESAVSRKGNGCAGKASFVANEDSILVDIPAGLPSLNRAEKLQKRASQHGFDWQSLPPVFDKLQEEVAEIKEVLAENEGKDLRDTVVHQRLLDEMGDVLFCCVNLARFLKVNPDEALRSTNAKFVKRFQHIEQSLHQKNRKVEECSLEELDALWDLAKLR